MINRSSIKYHLKKILPRSIFRLILVIWQKVLLRVVEKIYALRLRKFTEPHVVTLTHKGSTFSLLISPNNGFIDKHTFLYGVYEPFILDLFAEHLSKGKTFIDIGANIGQHSMYAATLVGPTGSVHAFEPIPTIYRQLTQSIQANHFEGIIHSHNVALGTDNTDELLYVANNAGGSSLVNNTDTKETITVHIRNGDKELEACEHIDVIKIDVEGYEYEVLQGIRKTLEKHQPILFLEFSGDSYKMQNKSHGMKILSLLRSCGYSLFDIEDTMMEVTNDIAFDATIANIRKQTNLLCICK